MPKFLAFETPHDGLFLVFCMSNAKYDGLFLVFGVPNAKYLAFGIPDENALNGFNFNASLIIFLPIHNN